VLFQVIPVQAGIQMQWGFQAMPGLFEQLQKCGVSPRDSVIFLDMKVDFDHDFDFDQAQTQFRREAIVNLQQ
jgi:hypothetical protein